MNESLSGLETNGIILLGIILLFIIGKFILWTIAVHRANISIQKKLGKETFNWLISDGKSVVTEEINVENYKELVKLIDEFKNNFVNNLTDSIYQFKTLSAINKMSKSFQSVSKSIESFGSVTLKTSDVFKKFGTVIQSVKGLENEI